jgi:hypothetical protein
MTLLRGGRAIAGIAFKFTAAIFELTMVQLERSPSIWLCRLRHMHRPPDM